jgi:hypothetical protein
MNLFTLTINGSLSDSGLNYTTSSVKRKRANITFSIKICERKLKQLDSVISNY